MRHTIALFGAAERGAFKTPHFFQTLPQLADHLGEPPAESEGLFFAIQALLHERSIIYFRVQEEGFSEADYHWGLRYLNETDQIPELSALCLPGLGDPAILELTQRICLLYNSLTLVSQRDLYDYLTS